ncbi:hypothetical protein AAF712_006968, partial [Marasmius tenuissimus]
DPKDIESVEVGERSDSRHKLETLRNALVLRPTPLSEWVTFLKKVRIQEDLSTPTAGERK